MNDRISKSQLYWYDSTEEMFKSFDEEIEGLELFIPKVELYWYDEEENAYKPLITNGIMPINEDIINDVMKRAKINEKIGRNENGVITHAMLSQEVREGMTGGSVPVVGIDAVMGDNIVDNSVPINKLNGSIVSRNRLNLNDSGFAVDYSVSDTTGVLSNSTGFSTTGFIRVEPSEQLYFAHLNGNKTSYLFPQTSRFVFYDEDKQYISGYRISSITSDNQNLELNKITVVPNAKYIRIGVQSTRENLIDKDAFLGLVEDLEIMLTNYEPYYVKLPKNIIEDFPTKLSHLENDLPSTTIGNNTINENHIVNHSLSVNKFKDVVSGKNKLNLNDVDFLEGYNINQSNGVLNATEGYSVTGFIPVDSSDELYFARLNSNGLSYASYSNNVARLVFYNENKVYVSGSTFTNLGITDGGNQATAKIVVPSNVKYVRFGVQQTKAQLLSNKSIVGNTRDYPTFASMLTGYEPYHAKLSGSILDLPSKLSELENDLVPSTLLGWSGKTWVSYGDSITGAGNSNMVGSWQDFVTKQLNLGTHLGRGVGGQTYQYNKRVSFARADGSHHSRNDSVMYDNPSGYTLPSGTTAHSGAFCAWDRITLSIPESIRNTIDLVVIMGGTNGGNDTTEATFVPNSVVDLPWSQSSYYSLYNGDFNIETLKGAVASTVMKFQVWCPNAVIVIATPLSGRGETGLLGTTLGGVEHIKSKTIKEVAELLSIPVIDVYATTGINPLNRTIYITDTVHPYNLEGSKAVARAMISGLRNVHPRMADNDYL